MQKITLILCFLSISLIGMQKQNIYSLKKVSMDVVKEGMIPEILLDVWIKKHNKAMDWVANQKLKSGMKGDPVVMYVKNNGYEK